MRRLLLVGFIMWEKYLIVIASLRLYDYSKTSMEIYVNYLQHRESLDIQIYRQTDRQIERHALNL